MLVENIQTTKRCIKQTVRSFSPFLLYPFPREKPLNSLLCVLQGLFVHKKLPMAVSVCFKTTWHQVQCSACLISEERLFCGQPRENGYCLQQCFRVQAVHPQMNFQLVAGGGGEGDSKGRGVAGFLLPPKAVMWRLFPCPLLLLCRGALGPCSALPGTASPLLCRCFTVTLPPALDVTTLPQKHCTFGGNQNCSLGENRIPVIWNVLHMDNLFRNTFLACVK